MMRAKVRLYLDGAGKKIVSGGKEAAKLFKVAGQVVSKEELRIFGKQLEPHVHDPDRRAETKQDSPQENKGASGRQNRADSQDAESRTEGDKR